MKSYVREFDYFKAENEVSHRRVVVMVETPDALAGFDLSYLNPIDAETAIKKFASHDVATEFVKPKRGAEKPVRSAEDEALMRSWRRFSKAKM